MNTQQLDATTLGALTALREYNTDPESFVKVAKTVERLYQSEQRGPVMRKAASVIADLLGSCEDTKNKFAHNVMTLMSKSADWHTHYDAFLRDAYGVILDNKPELAKQANAGGAAVTLAEMGPSALVTLALLTGGLGGAGMHYLDKHTDQDDLEIEKERAVQNEYKRLADEIDRKITARKMRPTQ